MINILKALGLVSLLLVQVNANSATWNSSSVTVLRGDDFAVGSDSSRTEFTYENAVGYKYGDSLFWVDITAPAQASESERSTGMYGEWSPRISLGKPLGWVSGDGFILDILFSNTFEMGNDSGGQTRANLHGFAIDFNVPNFTLFSWNFYIRDNLDKAGTTTQSTIAYKLPFAITAEWKFEWSAYIDIIHGDEGSEGAATLTQAHYHSGQQFKLDLGNFFGSPDSIYTGFEYQVWNKKYGIKDGVEQYNLKYLIQGIF